MTDENDVLETDQGTDVDYWNALVNEDVAALFLGVTNRSMQAWRRLGSGPEYIQISARCIRYTRAACAKWSNAKIRQRTNV